MSEKLKAIVVESNTDTRALVRRLLIDLEVNDITCYANGSALLKRTDVVNADIIIMATELENNYAGIDLIRHLARLKKLHQWAKVIFIAHEPTRIRTDFPLLGQKCDLIDKRFAVEQLTRSIQTCRAVCLVGKRTFSQLNEETDIKLVKLVKNLPTSINIKDTADSVKLLQSKLLMKLRRPTLIFNIVDKIHDPTLRLMAQMHYYFYFGQHLPLQQTIKTAKNQKTLLSQQRYYYLLQCVMEKRYTSAYTNICELDESSLHPPEVLLKSTLIFLTEGFTPAVNYLQKKKIESPENHYYRSLITINILFLCFMQLLHKRDKHIEDNVVLSLFHESCQEKSLYDPGNDFDSFIPYFSLAIDVISNKYQDNLAAAHAQVNDLAEMTINIEPSKRILLFIICVHVGDADAAFSHMAALCAVLADVEISPEMAVNYLAYDLFIESHIGKEARAGMLSRLGKHMLENRYPAMALRLFYRAYRATPHSADNVLNLLSALIVTKLPYYMETSIAELFELLECAPLDNSQKALIEDLKKRL
ncbi:response regulator [Alteromonas sediminis]|uniref:response regulator n=1 Tax=Alteromonas sediminis TaxID=2259342 RepID=UPI0014043CDD|nr:response regulator [Alteromonas sediminis]